MTRAAHVTECYGLTGVAYLVQCGDRARERLFITLEAAMAHARKHNDKHHHGEPPVLHGWPGVDIEKLKRGADRATGSELKRLATLTAR
ncbi:MULTISPECIES: hypothetical protein [Arthrobacter]|uniref:Uncharacterized protein n=1 Tax=Arthrobacter terricola TaxID=2547396 RepID=A0A4R5KC57_9MICC|nr:MULTISPECIES: hypothetical protein [Arthrobacter]MBT8162688.1 hypothetical protein [Arthrobacter sp. GN70]TDF92462.1 hypothetical protein E1809_18180 [Arthrobacter terricola]